MTICRLVWPSIRVRSPIGPARDGRDPLQAVGDIIGERGVDLLISPPNAPRSGRRTLEAICLLWPIASRSAAQHLATENQPIERR